MEGGAGRGASVLVVEDDDAITAVLRAWLRVHPRFLSVEQVGTLAAARSWLDRETPDIVVLDYTLPDGTAGDLVDVLRGRDRPPAVVLHTSHADFAELGRTLGCDAAVHKGDWAGLADRLLSLATTGSR
jgi:response regulator of citrate/malate metabolism